MSNKASESLGNKSEQVWNSLLEDLGCDKYRIHSEPEECLKRVRDYYENLISLMPGHVYWMNSDLEFLGCNQEQADDAGLTSPSDIVGKSNAEMPWHEEADELNAVNREVQESGFTQTKEEINVRSDGTTKTYLTKKVPIQLPNSEKPGVLGISFDISERKQLEEQLKTALIAAQAANKAKSEFIANMSHDIRTPLSGILTMAEVMLQSPDLLTTDNIRVVYESGHRLLSMLNQIIDFIDMDDPTHLGSDEAFSPASLLNDLIALFKPAAMNRHLQLESKVSPQVPEMLKGYGEAIHRTILNLTGNAMKFTNEGGVSITTDFEYTNDQQGELIIQVKDTGIGIPDDAKERIFERFGRVLPSYQDNKPGTGLGLSIVKSYIDELGGSIDFESEVGKGSSFTCRFPLTIATANIKTIPHYVSITDRSHLDAEVLGPTTKPTPASGNDSEAAKILVVEDNPTAAKAACMMLQGLGIATEHAVDGANGVDLALSHDFALILMDIGLPDMTGFDAAKAIHQQKPQLPIIALTGHGTLDNAKSEQAGLSGLITKPLTLEAAQQLLTEQLGTAAVVQKQERESQQSGRSAHYIDFADAVRTASDNEQLAKELLAMFYSEIASNKSTIAKLLAIGDEEGLGKEIHRIKGGAAYCGVASLHSLLGELYARLKEVESIAQIKPLIEQLYVAMDNYSDEYKRRFLKK